MKEKIIMLMLVGMMAVSAAGCGKNAEKPADAGAEPVVSEQEASGGEAENGETEIKTEFSFAELKNREFWFGSGAGAWRTVLTIREDGSFSGKYTDSEMGSSDPEKFPNGTVYQCEFNGKFTEPIKVNDYTYSTQIAEISYENEVDTEEIRDGFRYVYSEPYGLENAENILIYLPGTLTEDIPEECAGWLTGSGKFSTNEKNIPFYALNNEAHQEGFSSYDVAENIREDFQWVEAQAAEREEMLEQESLTQADCNMKTGELYELWDGLLNRMWSVLKQTKDADFMETLKAEQREWIKEKEKAIEEAGAGVKGGSMEPMVRNLKAAELTKERVDELMKLFEE